MQTFFRIVRYLKIIRRVLQALPLEQIDEQEDIDQIEDKVRRTFEVPEGIKDMAREELSQ